MYKRPKITLAESRQEWRVGLSQLLSKFLDNVNLGKILVDGGPGVLLALALLLLAGHFEKRPFLRLVGEKEVHDAVCKVRRKEAQLAEEVGVAAERDQQLQIATRKCERAEAVADEQRTRGAFPAAAAKSEAEAKATCKAVVVARGAKEQATKEVDFAAKHLEEVRAELDRRRGERVRDARGMLTELINLLLGLSILGYILGTLFSSAYRAIVLKWTPALWFPLLAAYKTRSIKRKTSNREEHARLHLQLAMEKEELQRGGALVLSEQAKDARLRKIKADLNKEGEERTIQGQDVREGPRDAAVPAMFYVGRGIISQQEYDGFVSGYYRWAEAATNLVLPVLLLGYTLHLQPRFRPHYPFLISSLAALLLYVAAQHSFSLYRQRLRAFIKGRLYQEQQRRNEAKELKSQAGGPAGPPRTGRQRLEISFEGQDAAHIVKWLEDRLQNAVPRPHPEGEKGER